MFHRLSIYKLEICLMSYENHIGEFLKAKLTREGRTQAWLAKARNTSRQNIANTWISKSEYKPSEIEELEKVLGPNYFDEFFAQNSGAAAKFSQSLPPIDDSMIEYRAKDSGFKLKIEIDPYEFNPEHAKLLGESLRTALADFKKKIEEDDL